MGVTLVGLMKAHGMRPDSHHALKQEHGGKAAPTDFVAQVRFRRQGAHLQHKAA